MSHALARTQSVTRSPNSAPLSGSDFAVGDVLAEKYRIEAMLGEGGMGVVLRATHLDLDCQVALKVVRRGLAQCEDAVSRLMAEAQAAASIRSEHVARVLDVGRLDSGAPFLVLEYLEGRDLAQILAEHGRLASHVAVDFVLQACEALSEAHGAGIVHRDLKPENLFLSHRADGSPIVKVLDFGISKRLSHEGREAARTSPADLLGSPLYMAPEHMRGSEIDARADIWSLGVVLYELCTGRSPFFAETIAAICARVIGIEPTPPRLLTPNLPPGLERIILRCLRKERSERPADVAELAAELAEFGSADAALSARSALGVLGHAQPLPTFERAPSSERTPTALSATLAVFGQGMYVKPAPRFRARTRWFGAALAVATALGGGLTLRAGQAREASLATPAAAPRAARAALISSAQCPVSTPVPSLLTASIPMATASAAGKLDVVAGPESNAAPSPAQAPAARRPAKRGGVNAWDPRSFGGRL